MHDALGQAEADRAIEIQLLAALAPVHLFERHLWVLFELSLDAVQAFVDIAAGPLNAN